MFDMSIGTLKKNVRFERLVSVLWFLQNVLYYLLVMPSKYVLEWMVTAKRTITSKVIFPRRKSETPEGSRWINSQ